MTHRSARRALLGRLAAATFAGVLPRIAAAAGKDDDTYDQDSVLKAATDFFGQTAEGLAKVIE